MRNPELENKPKTVLLIDDDEDERDIFEIAAAQTDTSVILNHVTACDKKKLSALEKPDLIFLDINMPDYDGFTWLKSIREKVPEPIPVIMYSTTKSPEKVELAYQLGANLFVSKPETSSSLSRILRKVFQMNWENPTKLTEENYANGKFHCIG